MLLGAVLSGLLGVLLGAVLSGLLGVLLGARRVERLDTRLDCAALGQKAREEPGHQARMRARGCEGNGAPWPTAYLVRAFGRILPWVQIEGFRHAGKPRVGADRAWRRNEGAVVGARLVRASRQQCRVANVVGDEARRIERRIVQYNDRVRVQPRRAVGLCRGPRAVGGDADVDGPPLLAVEL